MGWWQERGGTVMMVAGLWLIMSDPIDRWLPVPMPALMPGPTTTWLPGEGVPDYGAAIDAPQAERIAAGRPVAMALLEETRRVVDGQSLADFLGSIRIGPADAQSTVDTGVEEQRGVVALTRGDIDWLPSDPAMHGAWSTRLAAMWGAIDHLPADATLGVPTADLSEGLSTAHLRSPPLLLLLLHLGAAERHAAAGADAGRALLAAERLLRLSAWSAGIDDVPSHAAARTMRREALSIALRSIGERPRDYQRRQAVAKLMEGADPLPGVGVAAGRTSRLLALRFAIDFADDVRAGKAKGRMAELRINRPPDINAALRFINAWFDALDSYLPAEIDEDGLAALELAALPQPAAIAGLGDVRSRPLANRMIFGTSVSERREQTGAMVAIGANMLTWIALVGLIGDAGATASIQRTLAAILAVAPEESAADWSTALRELLGDRAAVTIEDTAIAVREPGDYGALIVRIDLGTSSP